MRLKSINVFSAYLGEENETKERTRELRKDSDFLNYVFSKKIKYIDNNLLRQLNISCSPLAKEINIDMGLLEGYPVITIPFDYDAYCILSDNEKNTFWVDEITKVLIFLRPLMNCKGDEPDIFINLLSEMSDEEIQKIKNKIQV